MANEIIFLNAYLPLNSSTEIQQYSIYGGYQKPSTVALGNRHVALKPPWIGSNTTSNCRTVRVDSSSKCFSRKSNKGI
jgi:hypothetical protein